MRGPVDVDALQEGVRERTDKGLAPLPELTPDDDEARAPAGQLGRGRQAVRDRRQPIPPPEHPGDGEHGRPAVEVDGVIRGEQLQRPGRDALLLRGGLDGLDVEVGLARAFADRDGAPVDAPNRAIRRQLVQVAPNGRLRDAEDRAQLIETRSAARLDDRADSLPPLGRKVPEDRVGGRSAHNTP
jgi:hypothetical protein